MHLRTKEENKLNGQKSISDIGNLKNGIFQKVINHSFDHEVLIPEAG